MENLSRATGDPTYLSNHVFAFLSQNDNVSWEHLQLRESIYAEEHLTKGLQLFTNSYTNAKGMCVW